MKYHNVQQVLRIHSRSIEQFGGDLTVRDLGLLESAVAQPRTTFGGRDLYANLPEKAAGASVLPREEPSVH